MARHGLTDVAALIFNTHGESMGRGAHPRDMFNRQTWPMSIWARRQFAQHGIRTELEASFQGGDGYLYLGTPELALATLTRIAEVETAPRPLVGKGGIGETVAQHHVAARQGWLDHVAQVVAARCKDEQRLGESVHGVVQHHLAQLLGQRRATRFAADGDGAALRAKGSGNPYPPSAKAIDRGCMRVGGKLTW